MVCVRACVRLWQWWLDLQQHHMHELTECLPCCCVALRARTQVTEGEEGEEQRPKLSPKERMDANW